MTLSERITAWHKHAGLSVAALAAECEVTPAAAYLWVKGKSTPPLDRLSMIANACGTTLTKLLSEEPPKKRRAS